MSKSQWWYVVIFISSLDDVAFKLYTGQQNCRKRNTNWNKRVRVRSADLSILLCMNVNNLNFENSSILFILNWASFSGMRRFLETVVWCSEKAAGLARACRKEKDLFQLLVEVSLIIDIWTSFRIISFYKYILHTSYLQ